MTLRIYAKPACVQCTMTQRHAAKLGLDPELDDITDEGNLQAALYLGITSAPVCVARYPDGTERVWGGFQPGEIEAYARALKEARV